MGTCGSPTLMPDLQNIFPHVGLFAVFNFNILVLLHFAAFYFVIFGCYVLQTHFLNKGWNGSGSKGEGKW